MNPRGSDCAGARMKLPKMPRCWMLAASMSGVQPSSPNTPSLGVRVGTPSMLMPTSLRK